MLSKWVLQKSFPNELFKLRPVWSLLGVCFAVSLVEVQWESGGSAVRVQWELVGSLVGVWWESGGRLLGVCWEF